MVKFSDSDIDRITQAISDAEAKSSGEIRIVVTASCTTARRVLALAAALPVGAACAYAWWWWDWAHPSPVVWLLIALVPALVVYFALRWFLHRPAARAHAVERRARREFVRQGVAATRDKTGILILLSLADRRVHLLADSGINAIVPPAMWSDEVAKIIGGLRSGRACDRLCEAIADIGAQLARHFPRRPDDADELPNRPIVSP